MYLAGISKPTGGRTTTGNPHPRTHVHGQLPQVGVQETRETETGGDTAHDQGDEVVEVTVGRGGELQGLQADVVESLVVDTEGLVRVLDELVHRERGVVGLNDGVGDLEHDV